MTCSNLSSVSGFRQQPICVSIDDRLRSISDQTKLRRVTCTPTLATLALDRFTCLTTCDGQTFGHAVTAPITVCNAGQVKLTINVGDTVQDRSWIEVDILNAANNEPISGYADEACVALDEDGQAVTAIWKAHQTLADVGCKKIRLRFRLYGNAKLYSFYFDEM